MVEKASYSKSSSESVNEKETGVEVDTYDRHIVPAETKARKEREGDGFKQTVRENTAEDAEGVSTTEGYTTDKEGLTDNFAIEPEMYVNEPGDLRDREEELKAERAKELNELNQDEEGKLTMEEDKRGKGQGAI